jgi:DNA-binding NarL/FixJ family response regulator
MKPKKEKASKQSIRLAIVEDEEWMRNNLSRVIDDNPGLCCVGAFATAEEALKEMKDVQPDVVLLDINLPGMNGVECLRHLRSVLPEARYLMLTVFEESDKIFRSLLAGASGYLLKRSSTPELLNAIREVYDGGSPMSSSIARRVVTYFNQMGQKTSKADVLSQREKEVLELLGKGAAYKDIADQLSLSIDTIRMNVRHIYAKLHVHSRSEATAKYGDILRNSWLE